MTSQKKLKHAVRTRMAVTGERYAAARRSLTSTRGIPDVTGDASPPQPSSPLLGLLPGYGRVGGPIAELSALANGLAAVGVRNPVSGHPYSEAMLFGLGGGPGGGYFMFQYGGAPTVAVIGTRHLWQDSAAFLRSILERLGVDPDIGETSGRTKADAALAAAVDAGRPTLAWTDRASLPWQFLPAEYRKSWWEIVGICGRDAGTGVVLVDDRASRPFAVDAGVLSSARGVTTSYRRRLVHIDPPTREIDLPATIRAAIRTGHAARMEPWIRNFGLPGLGKWAEMVADEKDPKGWPTVFPPGRDLYRSLVWQFRAIEIDGTGGGAYRPLYAGFLEEAALATGIAGLRDVGVRYRELGQAWSDVGAALLPEDVPLFARTRALEVERVRVLEAPDGPDERRLAELAAELQVIEDETGASFPMPASDRIPFFRGLRDRIASLHADEVALTRELASLVGAP